MYRLMKSEKFTIDFVASRSMTSYHQSQVCQFTRFKDAVDACEIANGTVGSHHYVLNKHGKEYFGGSWIDWPNHTQQDESSHPISLCLIKLVFGNAFEGRWFEYEAVETPVTLIYSWWESWLSKEADWVTENQAFSGNKVHWEVCLGAYADMNLIIPRIIDSTKRKDLREFANKVLEKWFRLPFSSQHSIVCCRIISVTSNVGVVERHGVICVTPDDAALKIIRNLNGEYLKGKRVGVKEYKRITEDSTVTLSFR